MTRQPIPSPPPLPSFSFRTPRIFFKRGAIKEIPAACARFGDAGMLITGRSFKRDGERFSWLNESLEEHDVTVTGIVRKPGEPTVQEVDALAGLAREESPAWIIGIGGGSTIDLAKAVAGLATNAGSAAEYQDGKPLEQAGIPFIAVPTTAGTGAEITNNAVLIDEDRNIKKSMRGDHMLARRAVLDPGLTISMPPTVTAHSGLDALTQAIEAFVSKASNPLSDALAREAIMYILANLPLAWRDGTDIHSRERMLVGSTASALAFSNAKLGAVHGLAHPLGVLHGIPHGLACAILLPRVMKFNLNGKQPDVMHKFADIGRMMQSLHVPGIPRTPAANEMEAARHAVRGTFSLISLLEIPTTLGALDVKEGDIPRIVEETGGSSLANNPRDTDPGSLAGILRDAL